MLRVEDFVATGMLVSGGLTIIRSLRSFFFSALLPGFLLTDCGGSPDPPKAHFLAIQSWSERARLKEDDRHPPAAIAVGE
jgi:hypothetical protein